MCNGILLTGTLWIEPWKVSLKGCDDGLVNIGQAFQRRAKWCWGEENGIILNVQYAWTRRLNTSCNVLLPHHWKNLATSKLRHSLNWTPYTWHPALWGRLNSFGHQYRNFTAKLHYISRTKNSNSGNNNFISVFSTYFEVECPKTGLIIRGGFKPEQPDGNLLCVSGQVVSSGYYWMQRGKCGKHKMNIYIQTNIHGTKQNMSAPRAT